MYSRKIQRKPKQSSITALLSNLGRVWESSFSWQTRPVSNESNTCVSPPTLIQPLSLSYSMSPNVRASNKLASGFDRFRLKTKILIRSKYWSEIKLTGNSREQLHMKRLINSRKKMDTCTQRHLLYYRQIFLKLLNLQSIISVRISTQIIGKSSTIFNWRNLV